MHETIESQERKDKQPLLNTKERLSALDAILEFDDIKKKIETLETYDQVQIKQWRTLIDKLKDEIQLDQLYQQLKNLMIDKLACPPEWFTKSNLYQIYEAHVKQLAQKAGESLVQPDDPPVKKKYVN